MRLLRLEIKRVLTTKRTCILLIVAVSFSILMAYIPATFESVTYMGEQGEEKHLKGVNAIKYLRQIRSDMQGAVTPEKVRTALEIFQKCLEKYNAVDIYELPEEADIAMLLLYWDYIHGIREAFADLETGMAPTLMEIDPQETDQYYEKIRARVEALIKMEQPDHISAQENAMNIYDKVEMPFQYYYGVSSNSLEYQMVLIYIITILCVVIAAPIFTSDYQTKADDILRCTKHGKEKMAGCKIVSTLLICGGIFLLCGVVWIIITNTLFGWESTKTSLQVIFSASSLPNLNVGETQWIILGCCGQAFL